MTRDGAAADRGSPARARRIVARGRGTLALGLVVLTLAAAPPPSTAAATTDAAALEAVRLHRRELKQLQLAILQQRAREEARESRERLRRVARALRSRRPGALPVPEPRDRRVRGLEGLPRPVPVHAAPPSRSAGLGLDVAANDRKLDPLGVTQAEVSVAARGLDMVAAWNDGGSFTPPGPMGFGWSRDGGRTWVDGGDMPLTGGVALWVGDPTVQVDERTGTFYVGSMAIAYPPAPARNALVVVAGSFADTGFVWQTPTVVRAVRDTIPDKLWLAIDPRTGDLHLTYTTFVIRRDSQTDWIDLQSSRDGNLTWSPPTRLSAVADDGLVHGARPAVGPDGEVHVVWSAVDTTDHGAGGDYLRARASHDGGRTFEAEATVATVFTNFSSGAPGFNRGYGIAFPALAVDRSDGPHRGRVYVAWNECLNPFDDLPGGPVSRPELEPNNAPSSAMAVELESTVEASFASSTDQDYYRVELQKGETFVCYVDSIARGLYVSVRLFCGGALTRLALNAPPREARRRILFFTAPEDGPYIILIQAESPASGIYRFRTGLVHRGPERGRDHRDVFLAHSDDGRTWSEPVRVNDSPPWFDDWLPEVAVSGHGIAYVTWYDWRDAVAGTCGGSSHLWVARSTDGGEAWESLGALSSAPSEWSFAAGNLIPNQGDYTGLFADSERLVAAWSDVRDGDPDIRVATLDLASEPRPPAAARHLALERVQPNPARTEVVADFVLVQDGPARIELFDHLGRRWKSEAVPAGARGRRQARMALDGSLPPGIYLVRVTQGAASAAKRIAILR